MSLACAVALVLLIDASGSVSADNFTLQRDATARAIESPAIVQTIDPDMPLAVTAIYWAGDAVVAVDWRLVRGQESARSFARELRSFERDELSNRGSTMIGMALAFALSHIERGVPCEAERTVIDVSGDGSSMGRPLVQEVRDEAIALGYTINGLPILAGEPGIAEYYREHVTTPDGFVEPATSWADFDRAIRAKMVREIASAR